MTNTAETEYAVLLNAIKRNVEQANTALASAKTPDHKLAILANNGDIALAHSKAAAHVIRSLLAENARLKSIIQRRLDCDGSNGIWVAKLHLDLTEEMRAALHGDPQ